LFPARLTFANALDLICWSNPFLFVRRTIGTVPLSESGPIVARSRLVSSSRLVRRKRRSARAMARTAYAFDSTSSYSAELI
jgi:hypothetical protein